MIGHDLFTRRLHSCWEYRCDEVMCILLWFLLSRRERCGPFILMVADASYPTRQQLHPRMRMQVVGASRPTLPICMHPGVLACRVEHHWHRTIGVIENTTYLSKFSGILASDHTVILHMLAEYCIGTHFLHTQAWQDPRNIMIGSPSPPPISKRQTHGFSTAKKDL